ncbi:hypothetical protein [Polaromonas jejuensis]|uniref:hypothetical protein n=1 Tax=Polaromonas jejuensis TaxID=457502 RepID=UPI000A4170DA
MSEDQQLTGQTTLPAQLLSCTPGEFADGLDQRVQVGDRMTEATGAGYFFFGLRSVLQLNARLALQLAHCSHYWLSWV